MKYSNTALKELKKRYKNILLKCALINAAALLAFAMPAMAEISNPLNYDGETGSIIENVQINTSETDGIFVATSKGTVGTLSIVADTVSVTTTATGNYAGIWVANRTADNPAPSQTATIDIKANNIHVSAPEKALTAMSNGVMNLSGNTVINAPNAILTRGYSTININTDNTDKTLKMTGNVEFNYEKSTSGSPIDSTVNINLNGADSFWQGNVIRNWSTDIAENEKTALLKVEKGLQITLNDGASWTATAINSTIPPEQIAVTSLIVNKGTIHSEGGHAHVKNATINGDLTLNGTLTTVESGTVTFKEGSTLTTTLDDSTVKFDGNGKVDGTINLTSLSAGTYAFMGENVDHDSLTFADNSLYNINIEDDKLVVSTKSAENIAEETGASQQETSALVAMVAAEETGTEKGTQLASLISETMQTGDIETAVNEAKKTAPTTSQIVTGVAKEAASSIAKISNVRLDGVKGRSGGDTLKGTGLWLQGIYNHTKQDATSSSDGFKADSKGFALGVDREISDTVILGAGYGYMQTDADSFGRDLDIDGHNFFIYGKYQPSQWYVSSVLNYNYSKYKEKKHPFGITLRSDYDVSSYGGQIMTGYDMKNGLTPEAGLRYLVVDADAYYDGMQRIRSNKDDVLTAVAGVKYTTTYKAKCIDIKPNVRLAATYDIISDNSRSNVAVIGGSNYSIEGSRLHRFGVEAGAGITASIKNIDITLEYNGAFRQDYRSQGGMIKAKYNF